MCEILQASIIMIHGKSNHYCNSSSYCCLSPACLQSVTFNTDCSPSVANLTYYRGMYI